MIDKEDIKKLKEQQSNKEPLNGVKEYHKEISKQKEDIVPCQFPGCRNNKEALVELMVHIQINDKKLIMSKEKMAIPFCKYHATIAGFGFIRMLTNETLSKKELIAPWEGIKIAEAVFMAATSIKKTSGEE